MTMAFNEELVQGLQKEVAALRHVLSAKDAEIQALRDNIAMRSDELEQYQRGNSLRVGKEETNDEDPDVIAMETTQMANMKQCKRKRELLQEDTLVAGNGEKETMHKLHVFSDSECIEFRRKILEWFEKNKRSLPWRELARVGPLNRRVYAVLVSEIMLQQTQVATVRDYYTRWIARWPSFQHLAEASSEEVNEMWSGLGYYARARRLHEAAKKVSNDLSILPSSASTLQESLPGVGRYTAAAVASIVFGEKVAAVDGNVARVLARQRAIGGDSSAGNTLKEIWRIAEDLVDPKESGNFNEAMMELGATICTPKAPKCDVCPVKTTCVAYKYTQAQSLSNFSVGQEFTVKDIESVPDCRLCLPAGEKFDSSLGVMNYPRKLKKVAPRKQRTVVWVLHRRNTAANEYFTVKRPSKGLLADLWEFPCFIIKDDVNEEEYARQNLKVFHDVCDKKIESSSCLGEVAHVFSHILQTYIVYEAKLKTEAQPVKSDHYQAHRWMSCKDIGDSAVSTAMKKVFSLVKSKRHMNEKDFASKSSRRTGKQASKTTSMAITDYFKKK